MQTALLFASLFVEVKSNVFGHLVPLKDMIQNDLFLLQCVSSAEVKTVNCGVTVKAFHLK